MKKRTASGVIARLLSLLLCLCMVGGLLAGGSRAYAADGDEIRSAKKVISVAFDTSGSMAGDRWVYANYALQALTALLNEQDSLYITRMNPPIQAEEINLKRLERSVEEISKWSYGDNTPYAAVTVAREKLNSVKDSDPTTQYWLVVMTDGEFFEDDGALVDEASLQRNLEAMAGNTMSNDSNLRVVYLGMGTGAVAVTADENGGLYSYLPTTSDEIADAVVSIANLISGRIRVDNATQVDAYNVRFSSNLPLYSISVLSQDSTAQVSTAKTAEEDLNIGRNIPLRGTDPRGYTYSTIFGNAAVINKQEGGKSAVIPAGEYTITFSEPVDLNHLVLQYEPAIGLKLEVTRGGIKLTDADTIADGDKLSVKMIPVVPGTDQEIPASDLPNGVSWEISYVVNGQQRSSASGLELTDLTAETGSSEIIGTMYIPGFSPVTYRLPFSVAEEPPIVYNLGIQTDQPDGLTYDRKNLGLGGGSVSGESVTFRITNDGVPLTKEELKKAGISLKTVGVTVDESVISNPIWRILGFKSASCTLKQNDDGSFTLTPHAAWRIPFFRIFTSPGDYIVDVAVNTDQTVTAAGVFTVVPSPGDLIDIIISAAVILFLLYVIHTAFIREKFPKCAVQYSTFNTGNHKAYASPKPEQKLGLANSLWPPFKKHSTARCKNNPSLVYIAENGSVSVKGSSLSKAGYTCYGTFGTVLPTTAAASHTKFGIVLGALIEAQVDNRGKRTIDNKNIPTNGYAIFAKNKKSGSGLIGIRFVSRD